VYDTGEGARQFVECECESIVSSESEQKKWNHIRRRKVVWYDTYYGEKEGVSRLESKDAPWYQTHKEQYCKCTMPMSPIILVFFQNSKLL
jgi:hypothetical protein